MLELTSNESIELYHQQQVDFFASGQTKDYSFRNKQFKKLYKTIKNNEKLILKALADDLGKSETEAFMTELGMTYHSLSEAIKKLKSWMKVEKVKTPLFLQPANSYIVSKPLGNTLIIAPFNYPFYLIMEPLIGAIAAGNTALIRPANYTPNVSKVITKIIAEAFESKYIASCQGGHETISNLLALKYDLIFFTGGTTVARVVLEAAAKNLTPCILELGGKSPTIVDDSANIALAAERIIWGKFINAGQTCIAPDYVMVHESVKESLLLKMKEVLIKFYGVDASKSSSYGRIVSDKHVARLHDLLKADQEYIYYGGDIKEKQRYIQPTILSLNNFDAESMKEEIFGPILPVISYKRLDEVINHINCNPHPLALYLFSENRRNIAKIMKQTISGGACINDVLDHVSNSNLPFGGVGNSGMGSYHGKKSFDSFSHKQSVLDKKGNYLSSLINPPHNKKQLTILRKYFK